MILLECTLGRPVVFFNNLSLKSVIEYKYASQAGNGKRNNVLFILTKSGITTAHR